jgi:hypothetical protein
MQRVMTDTDPLTARSRTPSRAARSSYATCAPQLYRRAPTARAERFIRTLLAERAPGAIYRHKRQRTAALSVWLDHYNTRESHGTFSPQPRPPASRN